MVKGVSRQVIVVRPQETGLFDQAIFILKDRAAPEGVTDEQIIEQARRAADEYIRRQGHRALGRNWRPVLYMLLGALCVAVPWALWLFLW